MFTDPVLLASWEGLGSTREGPKVGVPAPHIPIKDILLCTNYYDFSHYKYELLASDSRTLNSHGPVIPRPSDMRVAIAPYKIDSVTDP